MTSLNPKQFTPWYHTSRADLTPGKDQILPANDERVGGSHYGYSKHDGYGGGWEEDRGDHTFAADTEAEAEAWLPSKNGRPVTYVVDPGEDYEVEDHHTMTDGIHAKVRGPMSIVDRIDIPIPEHGATQGTLPPQNWGHFNRLPEGYEGPATMGPQDPERDNFIHHFPVLERMQRENDEAAAEVTARLDRQGYERRWREAGQQGLFP